MAAEHIIVTGGTGYIGARLIERALTEGRRITVLGRRPGQAGTTHVPWSLGDPLPDIPMLGAAALIHLAHNWQGEADNIIGTETLFSTARDVGVVSRVFISSQSARRDALNRYGRMKWAIEQRLPEATSLRVGLVYGGPRKAMYGLLCRLSRLPFLPMIEPGRTVQPIHLDEVVSGILAAADGRANGVLALAGDTPVAFGDVLREFARQFHGSSLPIIPIPLRLALLMCDISARMPLIPTIDRERVLGLAGTEPIDSALDLARLGIHVAPIGTRLAGEASGRRGLLLEARAFLRHAGIRPGLALLRRYARAFPQGAMVRPHWGLRLREPVGGTGDLARRMRAAARIAEASAPGEAMLARGSRAGRLVRLGMEGGFELLVLPIRLIANSIR